MSRSVYEKLGVRPLINGMGTYTVLGGSLMPAEVVGAMVEAASHFVDMVELHEQAGARIAGLLGVPAAMVTAGAASAITVATAACITGGEDKLLEQLPDTGGRAPGIILQKSHRSGYEAQMQMAGARLVWVETESELEAAISEHTCMLFYLNRHAPLGRISPAQWVRAGRTHRVPTLLDAAADVPPASHLSRYVDEGFDLVALSGGKALRGPQGTGLLLGRRDLVAAARKAISPHEGIGRGMKVGKEEIIGLVAAVERYLKLDHAAEFQLWECKAASLASRLATVPWLEVRCEVPEIANHAPHVVVEWSGETDGFHAQEIACRLRQGDPPIAILAEGEHTLRIAVWTLQGDEHELVAARLLALLL